MDPQYQQFMTVVGALGKLVVLSILLERSLAFIFEHDWFRLTTSRRIADPAAPDKLVWESRIPGLKGTLALGAALSVCYGYDFNVIAALFNTTQTDRVGTLITGVVAAGGSAGAIAVFQGFLNMNKDSRDALIAAKKANAEAERDLAEAKAKEAAAKKLAAEAMKAQAELITKNAAPGIMAQPPQSVGS